MASFYVLLPSNVKGGTLSSFTVKLPDRVSLSGDWEVGLVEISYQNTWYNISKPDHAKFSLINFRHSQELVEGAIALNNYRGVDELLTALRDELYHLRLIHGWGDVPPIKLLYKPSVGRVQVKTYPPHVYLFVSERLAYMLGFDRLKITTSFKKDGENRLSTAEHPPDIKAGFYFMYVYCDLVAPQMVGDKFVPLLKTLSVSSHFGDIVQKDFVNPHYVPIIKKDFESIEINIKDDVGDYVPFNFGKTILKLHFRKKRQ